MERLGAYRDEGRVKAILQAARELGFKEEMIETLVVTTEKEPARHAGRRIQAGFIRAE